MPIAVFDIDGTLTDTMDVDVECYEAAIQELLGVPMPDDWSDFDEVTDSAILAVACERHGRPAPDAGTERRIAARVAELLTAAAGRTPERFSPVPGARSVFSVLRSAGWRIAMATGAWRPSALVKLATAGIPLEGVPLATSTDHPVRSDIIRHAVASLASLDPDEVVYVGDGVWDGRAASSLGYGFVGVGSRARHEALVRVGAAGVVPDLADTDRLLMALARARR